MNDMFKSFEFPQIILGLNIEQLIFLFLHSFCISSSESKNLKAYFLSQLSCELNLVDALVEERAINFLKFINFLFLINKSFKYQIGIRLITYSLSCKKT